LTKRFLVLGIRREEKVLRPITPPVIALSPGYIPPGDEGLLLKII
jgi:hypothetical protein